LSVSLNSASDHSNPSPPAPVGPRTLFRIASNIAWLFGDRIFRMGVGVLVTLAVARYLGPAQFGVLNYGVAIVSLFGAVACLGTDTIVVRDLVRDGKHASTTLGTAFFLRLPASLLATVLCLTLAWFQRGDRATAVVLAVVSTTLLFQNADILDLFFQSEISSKHTVIAKNLAFAAAAILRVALVCTKSPLIGFAICNVVESILGAALLCAIYLRHPVRITGWRYASDYARRLMRDSWPLVISGTAIMIYMRIDIVMLGRMAGPAAVGVYAAATRISELWYFIPVAIVSSVSPVIIASRSDPVLYYSRIQQLFSLMLLLSATIGAVVALSSGVLIQRLFGPAFIQAGPVLAIHIWAGIFVFQGMAQLPWDTSENMMRLSLVRTVAGAVSNIVINLYLIPLYGAKGAAIATVVSYALSTLVGNLLFRETRGIFVMQIRALRLSGCSELLATLASLRSTQPKPVAPKEIL